MREPGFIFWGLFLVFALLVVGYAVWMLRLERRERRADEGPKEESS